MQEIRDAGFETQQDEWSPGVSSIAVPVFGVGDHPVAALSVSPPTIRFEPKPWIDPLFRTADALSVLLKSMAVGPRQLAGMSR
jgi:DNA-binding IclR family transcriptional regulator